MKLIFVGVFALKKVLTKWRVTINFTHTSTCITYTVHVLVKLQVQCNNINTNSSVNKNSMF